MNKRVLGEYFSTRNPDKSFVKVRNSDESISIDTEQTFEDIDNNNPENFLKKRFIDELKNGTKVVIEESPDGWMILGWGVD